jgi:hypothetical protein
MKAEMFGPKIQLQLGNDELLLKNSNINSQEPNLETLSYSNKKDKNNILTPNFENAKTPNKFVKSYILLD